MTSRINECVQTTRLGPREAGCLEWQLLPTPESRAGACQALNPGPSQATDQIPSSHLGPGPATHACLRWLLQHGTGTGSKSWLGLPCPGLARGTGPRRLPGTGRCPPAHGPQSTRCPGSSQQMTVEPPKCEERGAEPTPQPIQWPRLKVGGTFFLSSPLPNSTGPVTCHVVGRQSLAGDLECSG